MFRVVINKFRHEQKKKSIILREVDINSKMLFHNTILTLRLIICLRMKNCKKFTFDFQNVT